MQSTSASFAQLFITDLYVTSPVEQSLVICPDVTAVEDNVPDKSNVMFKPETDTTVCVACFYVHDRCSTQPPIAPIGF